MYEVAYAGLVLAAAALIVSLVGRRSGWPIGQAFTEELILVPIYAAHFRHLDFFPVWSSSDGLGLGTPVLLYYQKAFFYVSGAIYILLGGALKPTLIATIAIFLAVGAYGMRKTLALVTNSRLLCTVGSIGYLFTNYVFTDWLSRGDLPEFSALMIVPWLLFWCLNLVKNQRVSLTLIPVMVLLVDAHSAIALISVFTLITAMVTFVTIAGLKGLRSIAPRLVVAVGGSALLLAPTLLAELRMAQFYDPTSKVTHYAGISQDFVSFGSYFYDASYRWLAPDAHNLIQIDFAIWIPIAISLIGIISYIAVTRNIEAWRHLTRDVSVPQVMVLLVSLLIYLLLQLHISLVVYQILAPLEVIDYPYRMLAFITPIGIILVAMLANGAICRYPTATAPKALAVIWLVSIVVLSPITSTWTAQYPFLAEAGQSPDYIDYQKFSGFFTSSNGILYDEYLPRVIQGNGVELYDDGALYKRLHEHQAGAASLTDVPCSVMAPSRSPIESLTLTFEVTCGGPTRLALPISYNAYSRIFAADAGGAMHQISYFHDPSDPRIIVDIATSRSQHVVVHLPTLWGILS